MQVRLQHVHLETMVRSRKHTMHADTHMTINVQHPPVTSRHVPFNHNSKSTILEVHAHRKLLWLRLDSICHLHDPKMSEIHSARTLCETKEHHNNKHL
jgi:hypothetical protein